MSEEQELSERPSAGQRSEDALLRQQTMLSRTESIAHIGSWEWDITTDAVTWSEELFRIFQRDPREGAPSFAEHPAFYHPDDMVRLQRAVEAAITRGTPYELELRAIRKDGETRVAVARGIAEMSPGGRAVRLFGSFHDITDRKQAEDALRESEQKYRLLAEHMSDIVWLMDMDTKTTYQSPSSEKLRGFTAQEIKDLPLEKNLSPESLQLALGVLFKEMPRIEADPSYNPVTILELEYYRKDGSTFWLENKFSIIRDGGGKPVSILSEGRDISERKRVQDALRQSEDKYRKLFEMESDALFLTDAQSGKILDANMAAVALYGYSLDELLEMRNVDLSAEPEKTEESYALAGSSGAIAIPLRYHRKKDGTVFPAEINATSIMWNGRLAFIPVIRDITERKELEERIRQVRSDLLFAVSHDLKSPIQTLRQTQEMLGQLPPAEALARFQEYQEIWRRNLQRLERMINNLVDSQRGEEGRFPLLLAPCDPVELVKRVTEDLTGYALSSQVTLDLNLQSVPDGSCDEEALSRVVENLLTNAVKFSPKGGKVEVKLWMEGDALLLEVEDHGLGIPAKEQAQLFQPFQRGSSAQQKRIPGTGLGLYVCRRIVEEHGGSISLTSEEGKGTKVTVRLPWGIIMKTPNDESRTAMSEEQRKSEKPGAVKQAEEAMRENAEYYRAIYEQSPVAIELYDAAGTLVSVNPACLKLFGVADLQEVLGFALFADPNLPDDKKEKLRHSETVHYQAAFDFDKVRKLDLYHTNQSGTRWLDVLITPLDNPGEPICGYLAQIQDITERKQAEDALRHERDRARDYLDTVETIIVALNREGKISTINRKGCQLLGYGEDELIGQSWFSTCLPQPDGMEKVFPFFLGLLRGEMEVAEYFTNPIITRSGELRQIAWHSALLRDEQGQVIGTLSSGEDVTERQRAEEALQESEERYRALFDRSLDCVYLHDFEGRFLDANDATLNLLGYKREEICNLDFTSLLSEDQLPIAYMTLQEIRETGFQKGLTEYRLRQKNGNHVYVETQGSAVFSKGTFTAIQAVARDITERKQVEGALTHSHDLMRYIIEHNRSAVAVYDRDLKYIYVSQRYLDDYKIKERDVIGKHNYEVFPDLPQMWKDVHQKALAGEICNAEDDPYLREDGTVDWTRWECRPWYEADGSVGGIIIYTEVITERKRAEEALRVSETSYRLLVENANEAIFVAQEGMLKFINPMTSRLSGYSEQELTSRAFAEFVHPEDRSMVVERHLSRLKGNALPPKYAFRLITQDGSIKWVELDAVLIEWEGKLATLNFLSDITERKRAEEALRESEQRYRLISENTDDVIWILDLATLRFTYVSPSVTRLRGYTPNEVLRQKLNEVVTPESAALISRKIEEAMKAFAAGDQSVRVLTHQIDQLHRDGSVIPTEVVTTLLIDPVSQAIKILGVSRDITERKRLEHEAAKARADFLFAVSHELKTPLFLMASAQELLESLPADQRAGRFLEYEEVWNRNLHRLRHLIDNLVDSQRSEGMGLKITPVPTDLVEILQQTLKDVDFLTLQQRVRFHLQLDSLPPIPADPESIHRLYENLLTNAIKFSPMDGEVEIALRCEGEEAIFSVRDFGAGIPASEIPLLFQPFQRTTSADRAVIPGAGLGLYTAKLIAEAHGGSISLTSEEGKGTVVTVRLKKGTDLFN